VSSADELRAEARALLVRLALTSNVRANALLPVVSHDGPDSTPPTGTPHPADVLADELDRAGEDAIAIGYVIERARLELDALRRPLAGPAGESAVDLAAEVVAGGEGWHALDVAIALRCTPTFVRRARLAAGRDPERGSALPPVEANGSPVEFGVQLLAAGYSVRQASAISGVARSTLHSRASKV